MFVKALSGLSEGHLARLRGSWGVPFCVPKVWILALAFFKALSGLSEGHLARLWGSWGVPFCVPKVWILALVFVQGFLGTLEVTLHDFGAHGAPRFVFLRFRFT